ncbi:MAG TPA: phosphatase PAP2 family protein [Gaiellaceae bacterium]
MSAVRPLSLLGSTHTGARIALRPRLVVAALSAALFVALAALVAAGSLTVVDQYAVHHLMPGLYPYFSHEAMLHEATVPIASAGNPNRIVNRIADAATIPAGAVIATFLFAVVAAAGALARRRTPRMTAYWLLAYVAGNAVEVLGKLTLERPALTTGSLWGSAQVWKFDSSFPSGHTIRTLLLAALVGLTFSHLRLLAAVWAAAVLVLLEAAGTHTPTDIVGGFLVAVTLILICREAETR